MQNSVAVDPNRAPYVSSDSLRAGALLASAGLIGFGFIMYIAANWDALGRFQRFGLVGAVIVAGGLGAVLKSSLRVPGLLLALAGSGGMLALIGQTYQTGADAWQLFAVWAALTVPFVLAARSDAVWTPWAIIAMTAVALWYQTFGMWRHTAQIGTDGIAGAPALLGLELPALGSWIVALGLCALLEKSGRIDHWLGTRPWAFRTALVLTIAIICSGATEAVVSWHAPRLTLYFAGLLILAGIATLLVVGRQVDIFLLAVAALAIDTALIFGVARMVIPNASNSTWGTFFLIGLCAAGIVATTVMIIMRSIRSGSSRSTSPEQLAKSSFGIEGARPWPIVLLSGIGALLAALPFVVAFGLALGSSFSKGPATYVCAMLLVPAAIVWLRSSRELFSEQLAIVALAAGLLLLGWGLFRDLPTGSAGILSSLIALGLAQVLQRGWLGALLGAAATVGVALALNELLPGPRYLRAAATYGIIWSAIAVAGVALAQVMRNNSDWLKPLGAAGTQRDTLEGTLNGWLAAAVAGLALGSGATFLSAAHFGGGAITGYEPAALHLAVPARALSGLLALAACAWTWREVHSLRTGLAAALMVVAVALSIAMPALGATTLVLSLAVIMRRRVIGLAAAVAVLWIIGSFYYNLALPLTQKAAILAAAGAALAVAALAAGARLPNTGSLGVQPEPLPAPMLSRALAAVGLLLVTAISIDAVRSKEALIRDGDPVFVELAPVDPRSLMQGDYMALRFRLPDGAFRHQAAYGERPRAIGKRDASGVLHLTRLGSLTTPLEAGEIRIELTPKRGQWMVVTDAWFFKEGTAKKWEAARYGEFRVLPDGRALLVGLADKDRKSIN